MGETSSENIHIAKLRRTENWISWYDKIECTLIMKGIWEYLEGENSIKSVVFIASTATGPSRAIESEVQDKFEKKNGDI